MSASLPSEELPRRIAREVAYELLGRLEMDVADMLAEMIGPLDDFWQEEPATAYGQTDGNKLDQSNGIRNERNVGQHVRQHEEG